MGGVFGIREGVSIYLFLHLYVLAGCQPVCDSLFKVEIVNVQILGALIIAEKQHPEVSVHLLDTPGPSTTRTWDSLKHTGSPILPLTFQTQKYAVRLL